MDTNAYYALLIPVFAAIMLAEGLLAAAFGHPRASLRSTISSLACGLGQNLFGVFTAGLILPLYAWFEGRAALIHWGDSLVPWILAPVLVDFCYYCYHRASHRVAVLWAIHAVHHQSDEMNVAVALRQTFISDLAQIFFYWPLPLLGIDPAPFFFAVALLSVYQVALHTELFRRPGVWGWLFNTPAFHRLHHARQREYMDRNFGSTLIVWDRLFGTLTHQSAPPVYGIEGGFPSANPLLAQWAPISALARDVARARGLIPAFFVLFGPPRSTCSTRDPGSIGSRLRNYATAQALAALVLAVPLLQNRQHLAFIDAAVFAAFLLASLGCIGMAFDGHPHFAAFEAARLAALAALGAYAGWLTSLPILAAGIVTLAVLSGLALAAARGRLGNRRGKCH